MGIDIELTGRLKPKLKPKKAIEAIAQWFTNADDIRLAGPVASGEDEHGVAIIQVPLFPNCDPLSIEEDPRGIALSARTSQVGPGYHEFICDVARRMGKQLEITWCNPLDIEGNEIAGDDTGFFESGDRVALERAMLRWLSVTCNSCIAQVGQHGSETLESKLCMGMEQQFESADPIQTPLGPRSEKWVRAVAADESAPAAREFFPWWDRGETASVLRNRALVHMWNDVRWRAPLSEDEALLHQEVHQLLEAANQMDASIVLPCREWAELLSFGAIEDVSEVLRIEVEHEASKQSGTLVGYRRRPVVRCLGPFSVTVPGSFGEQFDADGTWIGFEAGRNVRMSLMSIGDAEEQPSPAEIVNQAELSEGFRWLPLEQQPGVCKRAQLGMSEEDGERFHCLNGMVAITGAFALVTITWDEAEMERWAMDTWLKITAESMDS